LKSGFEDRSLARTARHRDALAAINFVAARSGLPWEKRHMHEIGGFALGQIPALVIASRRDALTTDHLLDRRQISTGVTLFRRYMSDACRLV
jgi:hypothetical protein